MSTQPPYGSDAQPPESWPTQPPGGAYGSYSAPAGAFPPSVGYGSVQSPPGGSMPGQSYPPPMAPAPAAPRPQGGGLTVTGLVFGIVTMLCPILAVAFHLYSFPRAAALTLLATIPLGIIGIVLSAFGRGAAHRRGVATAGLVLSIIGIGLTLLLLLLGIIKLAALGPRLPPHRRRIPRLGARHFGLFP